jgi:hypothetical protein
MILRLLCIWLVFYSLLSACSTFLPTVRTVRRCLGPSAVNEFVQFTSGLRLDVRRVKKTCKFALVADCQCAIVRSCTAHTARSLLEDCSRTWRGKEWRVDVPRIQGCTSRAYMAIT